MVELKVITRPNGSTHFCFRLCAVQTVRAKPSGDCGLSKRHLRGYVGSAQQERDGNRSHGALYSVEWMGLLYFWHKRAMIMGKEGTDGSEQGRGHKQH